MTMKFIRLNSSFISKVHILLFFYESLIFAMTGDDTYFMNLFV